jgi:hypothetical protein
VNALADNHVLLLSTTCLSVFFVEVTSKGRNKTQLVDATAKLGVLQLTSLALMQEMFNR